MGKHTRLDALNSELNIVYRYLIKKGISKNDAEDATQEASYKYLRFSDSIRSSKVRSWLIRVALNYYYDQYRKSKKHVLNFEIESKESTSTDSPERMILENERNEELYQLLNKMNLRDKELLLLKYDSELSYFEISILLDVSINSIKTNLYRARKKLVKLYEEVHSGK